MGLSASSASLNINQYNNQYRYIAPPLPNRADITRGMMTTGSSNPLSPSTTAYATNANPALGGPVFISSADVLAHNAIIARNSITTQNSIEQGSKLSEALQTIAEQTPTVSSRFSAQNNLFTTSRAQSSQNIQQTTNTRELPQTATFSNIRTENTPVSITGRNAEMNAESATKFAAVNAGVNVAMSEQGLSALQTLQSNAAIAAMRANANPTARMDGMIPMAAASFSDFSDSTPSTASGLKLYDEKTETFNHILGGGGHGGGGSLAQPQERKKEEETFSFEQPQQQPFKTKPQKGLNYFA